MHLRRFRPGELKVITLTVFLLLVVFFGVAWRHSHNQRVQMDAAISRHLGSVLVELGKHAADGRYPDLQSAREILDAPATAKRVHTTSLLSARDLLYNPALPKADDNPGTIILGARWGNRLFVVQLDGAVRQMTENELAQTGLVPLAGP